MSASSTEVRRLWVGRVLGVALSGPSANAPAGDRPEGANVSFAKLKLRWNEAKNQAKSQLDALYTKVVTEFQDPNTAADAQKVLRIMGQFNQGLGDTLDDLYSAADPAARAKLRDQARSIAARYQGFLDRSPLVAHVDTNPFVATTVKTTLSAPLLEMQAQLTAAVEPQAARS